MEDFWTKMKSGIKDGAVFSANKIEQYSKIGKLKVDQFSLKKKIESVQNDIGVRVYDLVKDGKGNSAGDDLAVKSFIEKIDGYEAEIKVMDQEIERIRIEAQEKQDAYEAEKASATAKSTMVDDEVLGV